MIEIPMEVEADDNHFDVFDNVAIFSSKTALLSFPNFILKVKNSGYEITNDQHLIFAAVISDNLITPEIFDTLHLFGCAILNTNSKAVVHFKVENNSASVQTRLLDVIAYILKNEFFMDMYTNNPNFDVDANFFVKYGFIEPILINETIRLRYVKRPPTKLTLSQIRLAVASLKSGVLLIDIFIPKVVATTLSKFIKETNEASGNLTIVKYLDGGVALIGLNSNNISIGNEDSVSLPETYSPFVFHTHPDHITRKFNAFLSWPSGQDMMVVALSFFQFRDQLAHFVISPEGLWSIHITSEFQKLLINLRDTNSYECSKSILNAINTVFTKFEVPRSATEIDAIDRYTIRGQYLSTTKNYKLSSLFADVPDLKQACGIDIAVDIQLYNVFLIKWKRFSESPDEGVHLTFDYILDTPGGLTSFLFPSF